MLSSILAYKAWDNSYYTLQSLIDLCTELDESHMFANWQNKRRENATYKSAATSAEMLRATGQFIDEWSVHWWMNCAGNSHNG